MASVKEDEDKKGRHVGSEGDKDTARCKAWPRVVSQGAVETNLPRRANSFDLTLNEHALMAACEYLLARYYGMRL